MGPKNPIYFDLQRHTAAAALRPEHVADFQRVLKTLRHGSPFQLLLAEFNDEPYRDRLIVSLDEVLQVGGTRSTTLALTRESYPDMAALESALATLSAEYQVVHLTRADGWFDDERLSALNIRREAIAQGASMRIVLWLTTELIARLAQRAPDIWAWRSGVFSFLLTRVPGSTAPTPQRAPVDVRTATQRSKRIAELRAHIAEDDPPEELKLPLLDELAMLLQSLGEVDEALRIRREEELPAYERLGDEHSRAVTMGQIADILQQRGEVDEALRIHRDEALPVYERLGDARSRAVTMGQIADILQQRGEVDEALRILREEESPVYERLGDVRSRAATMGKIAGILQQRGEVDEALRILREEELPVYERLGDVRSRAVTMGRIADILEERGELDEALRIRLEEQLPVYERLGDVRSRAMTMGKIADILEQRGEAEQALRIHFEERLPVARRMHDLDSIAHARFKCAELRLARGGFANGEAQVIQDDLSESFEILVKLGRVDGIGFVGLTFGQVLADLGQVSRAREVLKSAEAAFTKLGKSELVERVQAVLSSLPQENA